MNTINQQQHDYTIVHDTIQQRRSVGLLVEPAPSAEQLRLAFQSAWVAPDHRRLKPTRFLVVDTAQRQAFGELLATAFIHDYDKNDTAQIEKIRQQVYRAPMLILALTKIQYDEKVPTFEQLLSTGAGVQNFLLSLHAQGFATMWRSGLLVESNYLKQALGLGTDDYISGIIYVGSNPKELSPRDDVMNSDFVHSWCAGQHTQPYFND